MRIIGNCNSGVLKCVEIIETKYNIDEIIVCENIEVFKEELKNLGVSFTDNGTAGTCFAKCLNDLNSVIITYIPIESLFIYILFHEIGHLVNKIQLPDKNSVSFIFYVIYDELCADAFAFYNLNNFKNIIDFNEIFKMIKYKVDNVKTITNDNNTIDDYMWYIIIKSILEIENINNLIGERFFDVKFPYYRKLVNDILNNLNNVNTINLIADFFDDTRERYLRIPNFFK